MSNMFDTAWKKLKEGSEIFYVYNAVGKALVRREKIQRRTLTRLVVHGNAFSLEGQPASAIAGTNRGNGYLALTTDRECLALEARLLADKEKDRAKRQRLNDEAAAKRTAFVEEAVADITNAEYTSAANEAFIKHATTYANL